MDPVPTILELTVPPGAMEGDAFRDREARRRIDLKGPLPPRGGPVPDARVAGLIEAVVRESNLSTGCDMVLVDMLGLTDMQRSRVRSAVAARVRTNKTIAFLEDA